MQVYPEKLAQHMGTTLASLYWVAGEDPLLVQEACDTVRNRARTLGFAERKVFFPEKIEHWQEILAEANAMSLFSDRILLDIRCTAGKIDTEQLAAYLQRPNPDTLILLQTQRPDSKSAAKNTLERLCAFVPIYPLDNSRFPAWLTERAKQRQVTLAPAALALLAETNEGNLLAALQELDKLALRFGSTPITLEQMESEVSDNAHFDVFSLNDAMLRGDSTGSLKILQTLQQEGTAPLAILGALMKDIRALAAASEAIASGQTVQAATKFLPTWPKHRPALFQSALRRLDANRTRAILQHISTIDMACKGMNRRDPWQLLQDLCLLLCTAPPKIN